MKHSEGMTFNWYQLLKLNQSQNQPVQPGVPFGGGFGSQWGQGIKTPFGLRQTGPAAGDIAGTMGDYTDGSGNWHPQRQQFHRQVINDHLSSVPPTGRDHGVMMMGGGSASGKSSVINNGLVKTDGSVVVDPDAVKEKIPEYRELLEANDPIAAAYAHEESSHLSKQIVGEALKSGRNVTMDGTGDGGFDSLSKKVNSWRSGGANHINAAYVTAPTEVALQRAMARAQQTGRYIDPQVIRNIHRQVSSVLHQAVQSGLFDNVQLYDTHETGGDQPALVMSSHGKDMRVHDPRRWESFLAKAQER
jgi:predicted ABC-type ATPase